MLPLCGRSAALAVLAAVLHEPEDVGPAVELERLCERRFLRVEGIRFRFRYDLVRQVLLESVSPARRRLLLQRLAQPVAYEPAVSATQTG